MLSFILLLSPTGWRLGAVQSHLQEETSGRRRQLQGIKEPHQQWRPRDRANHVATTATPHGHYPSTAPGCHEHHRRRRNPAGALLLQLQQQHCQQQQRQWQQRCSSSSVMLPAHGHRRQPWHELPGPWPAAWTGRLLWSSQQRQEAAQGSAEPVRRWRGAKPAAWDGRCHCHFHLDESLLGKINSANLSVIGDILHIWNIYTHIVCE